MTMHTVRPLATPTRVEPTAPITAVTAAPRKSGPVRRVARMIGGWTLLAVGAALLVLPGPGLLVIAAGLALLATEYAWAARLLAKVKERLVALKAKAMKSRS
jgi:uncharacterized protein (TIGR02611 family)